MRGNGHNKFMVIGTHRGLRGTEPIGAGRVAMGGEAGKGVGIGVMEGPERQVRSLGFLL